jgi:hypothetical protein
MAIEIGPGKTNDITWRFGQAGEVIYGSHEADHCKGGLVGQSRLPGEPWSGNLHRTAHV